MVRNILRTAEADLPVWFRRCLSNLQGRAWQREKRLSRAIPCVAVNRLKVRRAAATDLDVLVHQRRMMFEDMRHPPASQHRAADADYRRWAPRMMRRRLLRCWLVTDENGEVAGGGCVWLRDIQPGPGNTTERIPYLLSMYTEPKFRRRGVATMVVKEAMTWARARGYPEMTLHASRMGRKVYSRLGWRRTWEMEVDLSGDSRS